VASIAYLFDKGHLAPFMLKRLKAYEFKGLDTDGNMVGRVYYTPFKRSNRLMRFLSPASNPAIVSMTSGAVTVGPDHSAMVLRYLADYFREAPANFLVKYRNPRSIPAKIRRRLRAQAPAEWPGFELLCQEMHYAQATLRRRLRQEGQTYQSLKDDLRRDMALDQLLHTRKSVPEIAAVLGFAETSAFYRAFRKWTGGLPSDYRTGSAHSSQRAGR
jgi:AraC-like DNA-binding protein